MLTRLQQAVVLGVVAWELAWLLPFLDGRISSALWVRAALLPPGTYLGILGVQFSVSVFLNRRESGAQGIALADIVRAWWREALVAVRSFCWQQPFRRFACPDFLPAAPPHGCRGVVLLHGFLCTRGVWNGWLPRLRRLGVPFIAVDLLPAFGSIDAYVPRIDEAVAQIVRATGRRPVVVGHSMGGLAARKWYAVSQSRQDVDRVITIASPHAGASGASVGICVNVRQMRPDSPWLQDLAACEAADRPARFTCYASACDNVVFPASRAHLPGADNRWVAGLGHLGLLESEQIFGEVLQRVGTVDEAPPSRPIAAGDDAPAS